MVLKELVNAVTPSAKPVQDSRTILERKFDGVIDMTDGELQALKGLQSDASVFPAHSDVISEGEPADLTLILLNGWAYRYKTLPDGKRQIVEFLLPGDFMNLYAALFDESETSVGTLTECRFAGADPERILEVFREHPRLGALICWSGGEHDAILAEQIVRIGRRSAYERIAHLIMELLVRLKHVERGHNDSFEFPLTQEVIGDTLGLSTVHVNRTMKRLRADGLIRQSGNFLEIVNPRALAQAAQFDRDYLERRRIPECFIGKILKD